MTNRLSSPFGGGPAKGGGGGDTSLALAAAAITFFVFLPALTLGFLPDWDDGRNILANPAFRGLGLDNLRWMFTTFLGGPYQPLSWLTYAFDYLVWGLNPLGYHLTNVLLHAVNAALFQRVASRILKDDKLALLAALLFALHPLRVESVAWVTERRDVLSGFFFLLTLLTYLRRERGLSIGFYACSLLSKGIALGMPVVLLCLDTPARRGEKTSDLLKEKIPYLLLAAAAGLAGWWGQTSTGSVLSLENYATAPRALMAVFAAAFYVFKSVLPFRLSPLYELPYELTAMIPAFAVAALAFAAISGVCWHERKSRPALGLAWLSFLALVFPVLGFVKFGMQTAADRYTYIACMPFALLAAGAASRREAVYALSAACVLFAGLTVRQIGYWKDSRSLWTHALEVPGPHAVALFQLGGVARGDRDLARAEALYRGSVEARPDFAEAHNNLGATYAAEGKKAEARVAFAAALSLRPDYPKARENLLRLGNP